MLAHYEGFDRSFGIKKGALIHLLVILTPSFTGDGDLGTRNPRRLDGPANTPP